MAKLLTFSVVIFLFVQRAYAQSYVAEGLFVVDNEAVKRYVNEISSSASTSAKRSQAESALRDDIDYILTEVNKLFATLASNGLNVQIKVTDVDILSSNIFGPVDFVSTREVGTGPGVSTFASWLGIQPNYGDYDFAVLWTGYDLYGALGKYTDGYSRFGSVCDSTRNQGLVEFDGTYRTVEITAHQIARLLGSSDDGAASTNVMSMVNIAGDEGRWTFSSCSASDIRDFLNTLSPNCLLTTSSSSSTPSLSWPSYNGKLFDADAVCRREKNDTRSYMCRTSNIYQDGPPRGDEVCKEIYCADVGTIYCNPAFPSDGMVCGNRKRCVKGRCVPNSSPASNSVDDMCVFGDQPEVVFTTPSFTGTCQIFVGELYGSTSCYSDAVKNMCCDTCKRECKGPAGCECGDRSLECTQYTVNEICPKNKEVCCNHCRNFKRKRSASGLRDQLPGFKDYKLKEIIIDEEFVVKKSKTELEDHY